VGFRSFRFVFCLLLNVFRFTALICSILRARTLFVFQTSFLKKPWGLFNRLFYVVRLTQDDTNRSRKTADCMNGKMVFIKCRCNRPFLPGSVEEARHRKRIRAASKAYRKRLRGYAPQHKRKRVQLASCPVEIYVAMKEFILVLVSSPRVPANLWTAQLVLSGWCKFWIKKAS
jgi:hypothetical protein